MTERPDHIDYEIEQAMRTDPVSTEGLLDRLERFSHRAEVRGKVDAEQLRKAIAALRSSESATPDRADLLNREALEAAIRATISNAYYDSRNEGGTMETAADRATAGVMALFATPDRADPRPDSGIDVERLARAIASLAHGRCCWEPNVDAADIAREYARLSTPRTETNDD